MIRLVLGLLAATAISVTVASCSSTEAVSSASTEEAVDTQWLPQADTPSGVATEVPIERGALTRFLTTFAYREFVSEPEQHPGRGPHAAAGSPVRTWFSPSLAQAMEADEETFPVGAAAVKEMWSEGGELLGWAVEVKTDLGRGGGSWFWFEMVGTDPATAEIYGGGNDVPGCVGCHTQGTDWVISDLPL
ncbi:MAG: hypothetical protein AAF196_15990 [Planctomycetota bacterium]